MEKLISTSEADKKHLQPRAGEQPRKTTPKGAKMWSEDQLVPLPDEVIHRRMERGQRQRNAGTYGDGK